MKIEVYLFRAILIIVIYLAILSICNSYFINDLIIKNENLKKRIIKIEKQLKDK